MRTLVPFNKHWLFHPADVDASMPDSSFEMVTLPHTNKLLPHHNFDNQEYQFISTYHKRFVLPEARQGRRVFIDFDGAMMACEVFLNGYKVGENEGGYTPFSFDLTDYLRDDGENLLVVRLDSTERPDIPPCGGRVDYLTFGGIYRDVWLRYVEPVFIEKIFVRTKNNLTENVTVDVDVTVKNLTSAVKRLSVAVVLHELGLFQGELQPTGTRNVDWTGDESFEVEPGAQKTITLSGSDERLADRPNLWTLDQPHLYDAEIRLISGDTYQRLDEVFQRFGFREARFEKDGFYLNGQKIKLRGLNRHQTYAYIGGAAPARLQRKDADILKYELGCNIVRTSHYPQSPHFLNRCDEIGLLVFEEIPGWQYIGDNDWQGITLRDVRAMIERDRNHPSIVLWGVRINESWDNEALYTATNKLARELDPTRQTGGVRFFQNSQFLEDVFTFNDFSNTVQTPQNTPHLITEFNGHMFPTKSWDQEERLVEHALRHARIQDTAAGMDNVTGAIGWCAFDYNTHREFGSGDRMCYHGVSDIFRLPKFAAYFYESQIPPSQRPVLRAATLWTMGDRSGGGVDPLVVFSNCDEVEVFIGSNLIGRYTPDRESFPHLAYPPYQIRGIQLMWGGPEYEDLHLIGYINGQAAIEQHMESDGLPHALTLTADDTELHADGADMTRVIFQITDRYGNRLPYATQVVTFTLDGPGELIGENPFALVGGAAAVYVKAQHEPGTITVRAFTPRLEPASVTIEVR